MAFEDTHVPATVTARDSGTLGLGGSRTQGLGDSGTRGLEGSGAHRLGGSGASTAPPRQSWLRPLPPARDHRTLRCHFPGPEPSRGRPGALLGEAPPCAPVAPCPARWLRHHEHLYSISLQVPSRSAPPVLKLNFPCTIKQISSKREPRTELNPLLKSLVASINTIRNKLAAH